MNRLPPELIALLATEYLTSKIDQLAFLVASERHWTAFCYHATTSQRWRFCSQFQLEALLLPTEWSVLPEIYFGLQRLKSDLAGQHSMRYHYSLQRRRGYLEAGETQLRPRTRTLTTTWIRDQITHATFAYVLDRDLFILLHSFNGKKFCTVTVWPSCFNFHLPFEVMGQDVLLHQGLLYIAPLFKKNEVG